jgi:S1-C subfamily serine protease
VIVRLNGQATLSLEAFNETLGRLKPGQKVPVTVVGSRGERTVTVTLGELAVEQ